MAQRKAVSKAKEHKLRDQVCFHWFDLGRDFLPNPLSLGRKREFREVKNVRKRSSHKVRAARIFN